MVTKDELREHINQTNVAKKHSYIILTTYDFLNSTGGTAYKSKLVGLAKQKNMPIPDLFFGLSYLRLQGFVGMKLVETKDPTHMEMAYWLDNK